jgi:multidrug efflux pump subunit AcrA (membrane-fusion protein)
MVRSSLPLALLALACFAIPARAAQQQAAPAAQTKRWTNADMDRLRAEGLISIVGPEAVTAPPPAPAPGPVYASRLEDPVWYADQAAALQAELSARAAALAQAQTNLADARNLRGITGSINMAAGETFGVTPDETIANLQAQRIETQSRLDELADLARRNDIPPGVLRGTPA